jgi:mono/diheme cytochrome c family protein
MRRLGVLVVLALAAFGLPGCGSGGAARGSGGAARRSEGAAVFNRECTSCHTLSQDAPPSKQGGSLLDYRISRRQLVQFTREMPVRHPLTPRQLSDVVDYLEGVERRAGAGR